MSKQKSDKYKKYLKNPFSYINLDMEDFIENCPEIFKNYTISSFTACYYPISEVEVEMYELASEDFNTIEKVILALYNYGIKEGQGISKLLGLPRKYIEKILLLLKSYNFIKGEEVTDIGLKSLKDDIKYLRYEVKEKIYVDAVGRTLLTKDIRSNSRSLISRSGTLPYYPHIQPEAVAESDLLLNLKANYKYYKQIKKDVLNINVDEIIRTETKNMKFVPAYIVEFNELEEYIILIKGRYIFTDGRNSKYSLRPVFFPHSLNVALRKFVPDYIRDSVPPIGLPQNNPISNMMESVKKEVIAGINDRELLDDLVGILERRFGLINGTYNFQRKGFKIDIWVQDHSFSDLKKKLIFTKYINEMNEHEAPFLEHIKYNSKFNGFVIYFQTDDTKLLELKGVFDILKLLRDSHIMNSKRAEENYKEFCGKYDCRLRYDEARTYLKAFNWLKDNE